MLRRRGYIACPRALEGTALTAVNMKVLLISAALVAAALCAAPAPPAGWTPSGRLLLVPARLEAYPPPAEYPQTTVQPETNGTRLAQESESDESQSEKLLESGEYYVLLPDGRLQMVKYATAALKTEEDASADSKAPQSDQSAQDNGAEQQRFQPAAYYIQAQEEQKEQSAQYNAQGQYKFQQEQFQPAAYYIQAQEEQKEQKEQSAQYNNAQGPLKFQQQRFQPAAYPVFIRPTQPEQSESAQYKNAAEPNFQPQYPVYQKSSESKFQQVKQEPSNFQIELVQFPLQGSEQFSQTKLQLSEPKSAQSKAEEKEEEASGYEANVQYRDVKPIPAPIYAYNPAPLVRILKK